MFYMNQQQFRRWQWQRYLGLKVYGRNVDLVIALEERTTNYIDLSWENQLVIQL